MKDSGVVKMGMLLLAISVAVAMLVVAKNVLFPLFMGVFLSYLLFPLVWKVEQWGVHRALAAIMIIVVVIVLIAAVIVPFSIQVSNMTIDYTEIKEQFDHRAESIRNVLHNKFNIKVQTLNKYVDSFLDSLAGTLQKDMGKAFTTTTTTLFQIGILPVFTFFLLFYRTKMAYFIFRLVGRERKPLAVKILREISTVATKYLGGVLIVVIILAVLNSLGLVIIGVEHAIVLGVLAAFLNLIPYFGTLLGGLIPLLYVYLTEEDPLQTMVKIVLLFIIVQFLENNILTPKIVGDSIKLNPLAVILSLLLANLIWGIAGMLIAVPSLAIIKVIMRNIDPLKPYAYLLGDQGMENHKIGYNIFGKNKKS